MGVFSLGPGCYGIEDMTKEEFIKATAKRAGITRKQAGIVYDSFYDLLVRHLQTKGKASLPRICYFKVERDRRYDGGADIITGEPKGPRYVTVIHAKAAKTLRRAIVDDD